MTEESGIFELGNGWYIETTSGRVGPMETREDAQQLFVIMSHAAAARSETACTEAECFI